MTLHGDRDCWQLNASLLTQGQGKTSKICYPELSRASGSLATKCSLFLRLTSKLVTNFQFEVSSQLTALRQKLSRSALRRF